MILLKEIHGVYNMYLINLKTEEMCNKAIKKTPWCTLQYVPDRFKTRDICDKAFEKEAWCVEHIPDYFITDKICDQVEEVHL